MRKNNGPKLTIENEQNEEEKAEMKRCNEKLQERKR